MSSTICSTACDLARQPVIPEPPVYRLTSSLPEPTSAAKSGVALRSLSREGLRVPNRRPLNRLGSDAVTGGLPILVCAAERKGTG